MKCEFVNVCHVPSGRVRSEISEKLTQNNWIPGTWFFVSNTLLHCGDLKRRGAPKNR